VRVLGRIVRARNAGRAVVDEARARQADLVLIGSPRKPGRNSRPPFGKTVDYVLRHAPSRVMVAATPAPGASSDGKRGGRSLRLSRA